MNNRLLTHQEQTSFFKTQKNGYGDVVVTERAYDAITGGAMIINREWAMPSGHTFSIAPIKALLNRYVGSGKGWVDPFAGWGSPAEFTNDLNPDAPTRWHMEATDFCNQLTGTYIGLLFDPPYSETQMKELYNGFGLNVPRRHTTNFYGDLRDSIAGKIVLGGLAISFGWNSIGMTKKRGFEIIEILLVSHGGAHNDTIVTVDLKVRNWPECEGT